MTDIRGVVYIVESFEWWADTHSVQKQASTKSFIPTFLSLPSDHLLADLKL